MCGGRNLTVGVLALQGDVDEHVAAIEACGAAADPVRRPGELAHLDGLILPGGESTTMDHLLRAFDLYEPVRVFINSGRAVYGSCAGMILLAQRIANPALFQGGECAQTTLEVLDITVRRNAFGRQRESFEAPVSFGVNSEKLSEVPGVFIRAPQVEALGPGVQVLARVRIDNEEPIVAVRAGNVMATAFHPEIVCSRRGGLQVHQYFVSMVGAAVKGSQGK